IANHLGAAFLSTLVTPDEPGTRRWRLVTRIPSRAIVALDGEIVYDTAAHPTESARGSFEYSFEADLRPGANVLTVALFRLRRMALEHYAAGREIPRGHDDIWPEVARYALGPDIPVDEGRIRAVCDFIAARKDCADFAIQGLLRLMCWERDCRRLSPELNAL